MNDKWWTVIENKYLKNFLFAIEYFSTVTTNHHHHHRRHNQQLIVIIIKMIWTRMIWVRKRDINELAYNDCDTKIDSWFHGAICNLSWIICKIITIWIINWERFHNDFKLLYRNYIRHTHKLKSVVKQRASKSPLQVVFRSICVLQM